MIPIFCEKKESNVIDYFYIEIFVYKIKYLFCMYFYFIEKWLIFHFFFSSVLKIYIFYYIKHSS